MMRTIMTHLGYESTKESEKYLQYFSPFNTSEKTPSFFILKSNTGKFDYCKDHSTGEKGYNYIEFLKRIFHLDTNSAFQKYREIINGGESTGYKDARTDSYSKETKKSSKVELVEVTKLADMLLLEYLKKDRGLIGGYFDDLVQVNYLVNSIKYTSIAIPNMSQGYNHRNAKVKGIFGKSDISIIGEGTNRCMVFEGMIDYLSWLQVSAFEKTDMIIILNSTSHIKRAIELLKEKNPKLILSFLDNGTAGDLATIRLHNEFNNVYDQRKQYRQYDDLNDMLIKKVKTKREFRVTMKKGIFKIFHTGKKLFETGDHKAMVKELNKLKKEIK